MFWVLLRGALMIHGEKESLETAVASLKEAGFAVSQTCCSRPSCFDFAARKGEKLVFAKFLPDVDSFSQSDSLELVGLSECVSAAPLLIGEKTRETPLEDDTVYSRYNIYAVTPKTFENIMTGKTHPLIQAGPGGYYVEIDGRAIKHRRHELGLSVGKTAEIIGISRRTLYGYERGMAKASVTAAYNMIHTLGIPAAKTVNVFEKPRNQRACRFLATARDLVAKHKILMRIFEKSSRYRLSTFRRAPFDFVITVPEDKKKIIGGVAKTKEQGLDRRIDEILSVSQIVQAYPILIMEGKELPNRNISCIHHEELAKIKRPEDLISNAT